jgi:hypothetical protein
MMIAARNAFLMGAKLPYDAEVEWLQGDGASGILIPGSFTSGGAITVYYYRGSLATEDIFGQRLTSGANSQALAFRHTRNNDRLSSQNLSYFTSPYAVGSPWFSTSTSGQQTSQLLRLTVDIDAKIATWFDGTTSSMGTWTSLPQSTALGLFGWANSAGTGFYSYSTVKVVALEISRGGQAALDLIPVRVGSGSLAVGYLYDRVSDELFGNAGTGAFVIGPDK